MPDPGTIRRENAEQCVSRRVPHSPQFHADIDAAHDWYNKQRPGLVDTLAEAIHQAIKMERTRSVGGARLGPVPPTATGVRPCGPESSLRTTCCA